MLNINTDEVLTLQRSRVRLPRSDSSSARPTHVSLPDLLTLQIKYSLGFVYGWRRGAQTRVLEYDRAQPVCPSLHWDELGASSVKAGWRRCRSRQRRKEPCREVERKLSSLTSDPQHSLHVLNIHERCSTARSALLHTPGSALPAGEPLACYTTSQQQLQSLWLHNSCRFLTAKAASPPTS